VQPTAIPGIIPAGPYPRIIGIACNTDANQCFQPAFEWNWSRITVLNAQPVNGVFLKMIASGIAKIHATAAASAQTFVEREFMIFSCKNSMK
jgi:hypothetical protein